MRKEGPHSWHAHPRRNGLTARRKPQAREINRQYREFDKKICEESWRGDAASQYRRLLLEIRSGPDQSGESLSPVMSSYRSSKKRSS